MQFKPDSGVLQLKKDHFKLTQNMITSVQWEKLLSKLRANTLVKKISSICD